MGHPHRRHAQGGDARVRRAADRARRQGPRRDRVPALHGLLRQPARPEQRLGRRRRHRFLHLVAGGAKRRLRPGRRLQLRARPRPRLPARVGAQPLLRRFLQHQHLGQPEHRDQSLRRRPQRDDRVQRELPELPGAVRHGMGRDQQRRPPQHHQRRQARGLGIQQLGPAARRSLRRQERLRQPVRDDEDARLDRPVQPPEHQRPVQDRQHGHGLRRQRRRGHGGGRDHEHLGVLVEHDRDRDQPQHLRRRLQQAAGERLSCRADDQPGQSLRELGRELHQSHRRAAADRNDPERGELRRRDEGAPRVRDHGQELAADRHRERQPDGQPHQQQRRPELGRPLRQQRRPQRLAGAVVPRRAAARRHREPARLDRDL